MKNTKAKPKPQYCCRDCTHSYGWCSPSAATGEPILCRCPYKKEGGKDCIFMKDPQCDKFSLRTMPYADTKE